MFDPWEFVGSWSFLILLGTSLLGPMIGLSPIAIGQLLLRLMLMK